jgi:hypothetical protein
MVYNTWDYWVLVFVHHPIFKDTAFWKLNLFLFLGGEVGNTLSVGSIRKSYSQTLMTYSTQVTGFWTLCIIRDVTACSILEIGYVSILR